MYFYFEWCVDQFLTIYSFIYRILYINLYLNFFLFLLFFIITYLFWLFNTEYNFKRKFFYFFLLLLNLSIWGFFYNLENFIFLLLLTEFLIIFIFFFIYLSLKIRINKKKRFNFTLFFLGALISYLNGFVFLIPRISFNIYNIQYKVMSDDFFVYFYFFFLHCIDLVYLLGLLLTFFSIFFIFFYLTIKEVLNFSWKNKKKLNFLRKQNITHQTLYRSTYRSFQK